MHEQYYIYFFKTVYNISVSDVELMAKMLNVEKENLQNETNNKIKKKKSFTNSENKLLK